LYSVFSLCFSYPSVGIWAIVSSTFRNNSDFAKTIFHKAYCALYTTVSRSIEIHCTLHHLICPCRLPPQKSQEQINRTTPQVTAIQSLTQTRRLTNHSDMQPLRPLHWDQTGNQTTRKSLEQPLVPTQVIRPRCHSFDHQTTFQAFPFSVRPPQPSDDYQVDLKLVLSWSELSWVTLQLTINQPVRFGLELLCESWPDFNWS
jgi:hypothetical protein